MNDLRKDDGFILVVVIGILTILSLLTITFATLSRIEIRATRNYTDSVKCEMVAKAGLEHAIYELRLDKFGTDTLAYNDNDDGNPGQYGLDENFDASGTSWPGNSIFPGTDYDNDGVGGVDSAWIYLPGTSTATTAIRLPGNLLARYAVLITDDRAARVNINVSGDQPGDEGTSTTEIDMSSVIELAGLTPSEADSIASKIISERLTMPFGVLTESEIVGIAGTSTTYTSRLEEIFESYIGSGWETAYEDRKVVLTAFSADTIVCPPYGTSTTMLNINALVNNGAYTDIQKVEMIMDVLYAGEIKDTSAKDIERHQLAVNIKDFIDPDSTVTTYDDPSVPGDTYYGVERTPYINEVEAQVDAGTSSGNGKFIELFNPYDTSLPIANWTISFGTTTIIIDGPKIGTQTYYVIADNAQAYETDFLYEGGIAADQYEPDVNILTTTGETLTLSDADGNPVQVTHYGEALGVVTKTRQLNDPRPIPLTASASDPWEWSTGDETAGEENQASIFAPGDGDDDWSDTTWKPSFFIANASFSNKGYLGYIHRGSEWSSFKVDDSITYPNVLKYITITDPSIDGIDNDGDGATDSLDTGSQAGDFDGPEYRIPGLINVNTAPSEVLQSLPNIDSTIGDAIDTPGNKPYTSIGDLVAKVPEITGSGTKWDKEKTFRSISNLITTRSNVFTVYVTAQITDEALTVFAEKRILAIVDRSVNPIRVRYFRWITE